MAFSMLPVSPVVAEDSAKTVVPVYIDGVNLQAWLVDIEHFFVRGQFREEDKLAIVALFVEGSVKKWFAWIFRRGGFRNWQDFKQQLVIRFTESVEEKPGARMFESKQTGLVAASVTELDDLSSQVAGLDDSPLVKLVDNGLNHLMREVIPMKDPHGIPEYSIAHETKQEKTVFAHDKTVNSIPSSITHLGSVSDSITKFDDFSPCETVLKQAPISALEPPVAKGLGVNSAPWSNELSNGVKFDGEEKRNTVIETLGEVFDKTESLEIPKPSNKESKEVVKPSEHQGVTMKFVWRKGVTVAAVQNVVKQSPPIDNKGIQADAKSGTQLSPPQPPIGPQPQLQEKFIVASPRVKKPVLQELSMASKSFVSEEVDHNKKNTERKPVLVDTFASKRKYADHVDSRAVLAPPKPGHGPLSNKFRAQHRNKKIASVSPRQIIVVEDDGNDDASDINGSILGSDIKVSIPGSDDWPPVITIMGHVDHRKTTLLDYVRKSKVAVLVARRFKQEIGAYKVFVPVDGKLQPCIFLDTPGHEAFDAMRACGARVTDLEIIVVAVDDGFRLQTNEAITHAKVVAMNQIDKDGTSCERVMQELSSMGLMPEDWSGDVPLIQISALTRENIDDLLETVILVAELQELTANPHRIAKGIVIKAGLNKAKKPFATFFVQKGTLQRGEVVDCGEAFGKVRAVSLRDEISDKSKNGKVTPSSLASAVSTKQLSGFYLYQLTIIVKVDVQGSIEVVDLPVLNQEKVTLNVLLQATRGLELWVKWKRQQEVVDFWMLSQYFMEHYPFYKLEGKLGFVGGSIDRYHRAYYCRNKKEAKKKAVAELELAGDQGKEELKEYSRAWEGVRGFG